MAAIDALRSMTPPPVEYRRGVGQPGQLQYGEANRLNQGTALARAITPQVSSSPAPGPAQAPSSAGPAGPGGAAPFMPRTDEEKFLFAPTDRPNEPVTAGFAASGNTGAPPPIVMQNLPALVRAAAIPGPAQSVLETLLSLILHQAGR